MSTKTKLAEHIVKIVVANTDGAASGRDVLVLAVAMLDQSVRGDGVTSEFFAEDFKQRLLALLRLNDSTRDILRDYKLPGGKFAEVGYASLYEQLLSKQ